MADNFVRGYTFDGVSGLKTGANLEDLITQAKFTANASNTGNSDRIFDGVTLDQDASNRVKIKSAGVGVNQIAAAIAGNGLQGGAGSALSVKANGATIAVAAGGISVSSLPSGSVASAQLDMIDAFSVDMNNTDQTIVLGAGGGHANIVWSTASPMINIGSGTFPTTSKFLPGVAGLWWFYAFTTHYSIATNVKIIVGLYKNGALISQCAGDRVSDASNSERSFAVGVIINMNGTTDYIDITFGADTAGTYKIFGTNYLSRFMGKYIGTIT